MKSIVTLGMFLGLFGLVPAAHAAGLPQLDHTWFANQILWLVATFSVLYLMVSAIIAPTINGVLLTRETAISGAIAEAEKAKKEAENTRTHFESAGQSARMKAAEFLGKAQAENNLEATEKLAKLDVELSRKMEQTTVRIDDAVTKALGSMKDETVAVTRAMTEKLLGTSVTAAEVEKTLTRLAKAK